MDPHTNVQRLNLQNTLILDSSEIAETFNKFFINIATEIEQKIPPANLMNEITQAEPATFFKYDPIISQDILDVLSQLQPKHSLDPTNIPMFLLKKLSHQICMPLKHIINLSLESGEIPLSMKTAKVIPLLKSGDPTDVNNYRGHRSLVLGSRPDGFQNLVVGGLDRYLPC